MTIAACPDAWRRSQMQCHTSCIDPTNQNSGIEFLSLELIYHDLEVFVTVYLQAGLVKKLTVAYILLSGHKKLNVGSKRQDLRRNFGILLSVSSQPSLFFLPVSIMAHNQQTSKPFWPPTTPPWVLTQY